jgi:uncharacterized coiled-coil protein SlyX
MDSETIARIENLEARVGEVERAAQSILDALRDLSDAKGEAIASLAAGSISTTKTIVELNRRLTELEARPPSQPTISKKSHLRRKQAKHAPRTE